MEKKYMNKNKLSGIITIFLVFIFTLSACAQEHKKNESRLEVINTISHSTVLLNNQQNFIPVTKLAEQKFASINLGFTYQIGFDSLLNKYAEITTLNADKYKRQLKVNSHPLLQLLFMRFNNWYQGLRYPLIAPPF